jgi:type IV pilus assembly protein PilE
MQKKKQLGFTLIELLVVVAIVGVLAKIAYPSYQDSMTKSRRADAKSALLELSVFMERYYTTKGCYNTPDATTLQCVAANAAPALPFNIAPKSAYNPSVASSTVKANYDLTVVATPTSFTLTATPRTNADSICGTLTLNNTGTKTESGTGTVADCW